GLFHNLLDHVLNKVLLCLPGADFDVFATGLACETQGDPSDVMDELRVIMKGTRATAYLTISSRARPIAQCLKVFGTKRSGQFDFVTRAVTNDHGPALPSAVGRVLPPFNQSWQYFREGAANVIRLLKGDFQFFSGMQSLIGAFYQSITQDSPVPIPYTEILRL